MGESGQREEEGKEKCRDGGPGYSPEFSLLLGKGKIQTASALCDPEHFYLSDQHIIQLNPGIRAETWCNDQIQKWDSCGLRALPSRQKTKPLKPGHFSIPSQCSPTPHVPSVSKGPQKKL